MPRYRQIPKLIESAVAVLVVETAAAVGEVRKVSG